MRSIFSIRFLAAIVGVLGLLALLTLMFGVSLPSRAGLQQAGAASDNRVGSSAPKAVDTDEVIVRQMNFVDRIFAPDNPDFAVQDHLANADVTLIIDGERSMFIGKGTPGEDYCEQLHEKNSPCGIVADLLGEGVVWFALVPVDQVAIGEVQTVRLPAIDQLVDGQARLVNGWELPYDSVLARSCPDDDNPDTIDDFKSYREFRQILGDDFTSIYSIRRDGAPSRLSAVECRTKVPWAQRSIDDASYRVEY